MVEVATLAKRAKLSIKETLQQMKAAGVDSLPGGGAEIFADRIATSSAITNRRRPMARHRQTRPPDRPQIECHLLYGHVENGRRPCRSPSETARPADETHGFQTFIPLAFHPDNTPLQHLAKTTGMLDIKQIAVSRLVLDKFPPHQGLLADDDRENRADRPPLGADDIDGTVIEEKIYHDAGAPPPRHAPPGPGSPHHRGWPPAHRTRHPLPPRNPHRNIRNSRCISSAGVPPQGKKLRPGTGNRNQIEIQY